jgi:hypothetical protein
MLTGVVTTKVVVTTQGGVVITPKHAKIPLEPLGPGCNPVVNQRFHNHISSFGRLFLSTEHIFLDIQL